MDINKAYEILGVSKQQNIEEIKKIYKELIKKYHPDKYSNNELQDLAEEKVKEINEAYDTILNLYKKNESVANDDFKDVSTFYYKDFSWVVPEELKKYNLFRLPFEHNIRNIIENYKSNYYLYEDLEKFLEQDPSFLKRIIVEQLEKIIEIAIRNGYTPPSTNIVLKNAYDEIVFEYNEALEHYLVKLDKIVEHRRQVRRNTRERNNYNMARAKLRGESGITEGIGQIIEGGVTKVFENVKDNYNKNKIYKDELLIENLFYSVERVIFNCSKIMLEIITSGKDYTPNEVFSESVLENLNKYSESDKLKKLLDALVNNPYDIRIYERILELQGDRNYELEKIGNYFGKNIKELKETLFRQNYYESVYKSEEEIINKKIELVNRAMYLGLDSSNIEKRFDEKLIEFIISNINYKDIDSIRKGKKRLNEILHFNGVELEEQKLKKIDDRYLKIIEENIDSYSKDELEKKEQELEIMISEKIIDDTRDLRKLIKNTLSNFELHKKLQDLHLEEKKVLESKEFKKSICTLFLIIITIFAGIYFDLVNGFIFVTLFIIAVSIIFIYAADFILPHSEGVIIKEIEEILNKIKNGENIEISTILYEKLKKLDSTLAENQSINPVKIKTIKIDENRESTEKKGVLKNKKYIFIGYTFLIVVLIVAGGLFYNFKYKNDLQNSMTNYSIAQESNINISNIEKSGHIEKFNSDNITTLQNEETYYYTDNQILVGTLDLKTVENIDGKLVKPYYIFLEKPIEVIPKPTDTDTDTDGFNVPENNILELQLVLNENDINYLKQNEALGKKVRITGELFGPVTAHHYSNVLMNVKKIEILDEVTNNQEKILKKLNSQNISYESYYSSKFDFNVDYPNTDFKIISSNNDAIYLEDIYEKGISITIFGEETDQIYNIEDIYNFYKEKHKNTLGYNLLKKDFMVITYSEKNNLVYQKTMNGPTDYSKISLVVKFPKEYKEYMSPIIDRIVKTMKLKNSTSPRLNLSIEKRNIFYGKLENGKEIKIFKEGDIYTYEYGSNGKVEISLSRKSGEGVFSDFGNFGGNAYVYNLRFINGEYSYIISKIITNKTDYELEVYKNNPNNLILEKAIKVVAGDIDEIHAEIEKDNESYLSW